MGSRPRGTGRRLAVPGAALAITFLLGASLSAAASAVSSTPTPMPTVTQTPGSADLPSDVALTLNATSDSPLATVTVIADLEPAAAYGTVTLWDGSTMVSSGSNFRHEWSWSTDQLTVGTHHFLVDFTPAAGSGYLPSSATVDRMVVGAPTPARPAPVTEKTKDPQPIVVSIPGVKATKTSRPTKTPTVRPTPSITPTAAVSPTSTSRASGSGHGTGPLAMTGFDAMTMLAVGGALVAVGTALSVVRRQRRDVPRH